MPVVVRPPNGAGLALIHGTLLEVMPGLHAGDGVRARSVSVEWWRGRMRAAGFVARGSGTRYSFGEKRERNHHAIHLRHADLAGASGL